MNIGEVWIIENAKPWRSTNDEKAISPEEFRARTREMDAFLRGFCSALHCPRHHAYVQGDFFDERSHVVCLDEACAFGPALAEALQSWLQAPRHANWRVIVAGKHSREHTVVIYPNKICTSPRITDFREALE